MKNEEKLSITVKIGDKKWPLLVLRSMEYTYREAGKMINEIYGKFIEQGYNADMAMLLTSTYLAAIYSEMTKRWDIHKNEFIKQKTYDVIYKRFREIGEAMDEIDVNRILAIEFAVTVNSFYTKR